MIMMRDLNKGIIGLGVDIVEIDRVKKAYERFDEKFLIRIFSSREQEYLPKAPRLFSFLAGRFAAKEAVAKALGTGIGKVTWTHIEIIPESGGRPGVVLSGYALGAAQQMGAEHVHLSISHCRDYAVASALV